MPTPRRGYREKYKKAGAASVSSYKASWARLSALAAKRIPGHSDADITEHYTHIDAAFLAAEIRKIS